MRFVGEPVALVLVESLEAAREALAPYGIRHLDMPATAERVWNAIRAASRAAE